MPSEPSVKERDPLSRRRRTTWAMVLLAAAGCLIIGLLQALAPVPPLPEGSLSPAFPGAASFREIDEPFHHYRALDSSGRTLGVVIVTDDVPPARKGYLGEIGSAVGITTGGRITAAAPVRHRETPYYMEMIAGSGFWRQLEGLDLSRPFPDIDTVSGATVSSRAILHDVREAASRTARSILDMDVPPPEEMTRSPWTRMKPLLLAGLLALSFLAGSMRDRALFREAVTIANLIGVGFILNTPLTVSALSRILTLNLPGPENSLLLLVLVYILVSLPLQGRAYCRLVCPFGTLQQLINRLCPWQLTFPPGMAAALPDIRRLTLGIVLFLAVWLGWGGFAEVEPFFGLFSLKLSPVLWTVVILVLLTSMFIRRFWCNTLCPTGTVLAMASRVTRPGAGRADETV